MKNLDLKYRVGKWNFCYRMLKTISYIDNRVNELVMTGMVRVYNKIRKSRNVYFSTFLLKSDYTKSPTYVGLNHSHDNW